MRRGLARLVLALRGQIPDLVAEDPADGAHGRQVELVADPVGQQPVPDLPGKNPGVSLLVRPYVLHHGGGGDPRLAASDGPREDGAGLVVARQDFTDAAVRDAQLPADVTGPNPELGQLHYPEPDGVGERPAVHEDPAELVDLSEGGFWCQKQTDNSDTGASPPAPPSMSETSEASG